jgi:hypothetical protein
MSRHGSVSARRPTGDDDPRSAGIFTTGCRRDHDQVVRSTASTSRKSTSSSFLSTEHGGRAAGQPHALSPNYDALRTTRFSTGIDQSIRKVNRLSVTYSYTRGSAARGLNVNPAIDGAARSQFANVIDVVSDAVSRQHELRFDANINPGAMLPLPPSAPRINGSARPCLRTTRCRRCTTTLTACSVRRRPYGRPVGPANGGSGSSGTNIPD